MSSHIEKLRQACLTRGAHGIVGIGRLFRIMDDDGSKALNASEFEKGIIEYGLGLSREEIRTIFTEFDKDGSGSLNYNEFLHRLRPPLSKARLDSIDSAFAKMDKSCDGKISVHDLRGVYNASQHPKVISGELAEDEVFKQFIDTFDTPGQSDGIVTRDEFISYYSGISASIDTDDYFIVMMKNCWKL